MVRGGHGAAREGCRHHELLEVAGAPQGGLGAEEQHSQDLALQTRVKLALATSRWLSAQVKIFLCP